MTNQRFPRWIEQIANRTENEIEYLTLEFRQQDKRHFDEFLAETHFQQEELDYAKPNKTRIRIPFPGDKGLETLDDMIQRFMHNFQTFLQQKYGDERPTDDNPSE